MKFAISTAKMNSILGKVSKGVGDSKVLPITHYIKLTLTAEDGLVVTATDSVNFITYRENKVEGSIKTGEVIVLADTLVKLAAKTTKNKLTFTLKKDHLEVKGNGKYTIPVNTEDQFPTYEINKKGSKTEIETKVLKKVFDINEAAIATEMIMPELTGFNVGDNVTTTDGVKMCINDMKVFKKERVLIPQPLAALLDTLSEEKVTIYKDGGKLLFSTESLDIFGVELEGINDFPDIAPLATMKHKNVAKVNRLHLLEVLDRMSIFVDKMDNYGVTLNFKKKKLVVSDLKENSSEEIEYKDGTKIKEELEVTVSIVYLQELLDVMNQDTISLHFEEELPIKLSQDGIIQLLSTIDDVEDDTVGEEETIGEE